MEHVPYKGVGFVIPDVVAGNVDVAFFGIQSVEQLLASGKLKALGVTGAHRSAALPNVPAIAESFPGFEMNSWPALIGPSALPPAIVKRLNQEAVKAVMQPDFKAFLAVSGNSAKPMSPEETARGFAQDWERYGELVRSSGTKVE
jgi:tripartite-type tricarboxylate transporter receptor subunit TctC